MSKQWIPASQRLARDINFLAAFYDADSPTCQDGRASAVAAGYQEKTASRVAENLLEKYRGFDFKAIARAMGIDRISIGLALKKIVQKGAPRDVLSASRLLLANMGEITDAASSKTNISIEKHTTIRMIGIAPEELAALSDGHRWEAQISAPELPASSDAATIELEPFTQPDPDSATAPNTVHLEDARRLKAQDFSGMNLTEAKRMKGASY